jgi:serine/threonine protein kinase
MAEWLGRTIGKVRIDKYLARGGMGEVYLGTHLTLDRPVAVKVIHSFIEEDPDLLLRFQREAKVVAGLRHLNIVQIYDFDAIDGHPYIVMEYLNGPSLATYLSEIHKRNEKIPHSQVARLLKEMTDALEYAHAQGVIHRDIKPGNIMLHSKADVFPPLDRPLTNDVEAVLMDFGLVRIANTASHTISGMISGTPAYMSPEQAKGEKTDHRTDIYSLGIILYEMLAGCVPFEADSTLSLIYKQINDPPAPIPGISPAVQKVIDRALAKKPEDRYPTASKMAADFFHAIGMTGKDKTTLDESPKETIKSLDALPEESTNRATTYVKPKPAVRKTTRIGLGILSVMGLLAIAIAAIFLLSKPSIPTQPTSTSNSSALTEPTITVSATAAQSTESVTPTAELVPTEIPDLLPNTDGMAEITSGTYEVGAASADEYHSAKMQIFLNDFWIDQYQITFDQYKNFMVATSAVSPDLVGKGNQPVRGVSWDQAVAYCRWVNKRLPTEAEWEVAGRGPGSNPQLYPWGNDPQVDGVGSLPDQDTYAVGTLSFNKSPYDVYDMVGNIWEWVGEPYASTPGGSLILRGGRFGLPILDLSYRLIVDPADNRYVKYAGFRCAADQVNK